MTSSNLNQLPTVPPPNTIPLGQGFNKWIWAVGGGRGWDTDIQSTAEGLRIKGGKTYTMKTQTKAKLVAQFYQAEWN